MDSTAQTAAPLFDYVVEPEVDPQTTRQKFDVWIAKNPKVLELFIRFALDLKRAGHTQYGARPIIERIRWEHDTAIERPEGDFHLDNNYAPHLARLAMEREPELDGFFVTRKLRHEKTSDK